MILDDGTFMKADEFNELAAHADIVYIICPDCKDMTCTESLGGGWWLCYECGRTFFI